MATVEATQAAMQTATQESIGRLEHHFEVLSDELREFMKEIRHTMYGNNGDRGVLTRLATLETKQNAMGPLTDRMTEVERKVSSEASADKAQQETSDRMFMKINPWFLLLGGAVVSAFSFLIARSMAPLK